MDGFRHDKVFAGNTLVQPTRKISCKAALSPDLVEPLRIREYLCRRNEGDRYGGYYTLREDTCTIADFCDAGKDLGGLFCGLVILAYICVTSCLIYA